jgi:signal transduction histidine kinase
MAPTPPIEDSSAVIPILRFLGGVREGDRVPVNGEVVLGRASTCDIALADRRMSRRHARIWVEDGGTFIEDMGSHNGTYVNGARAKHMQLFSGDVVRIGATQLEVEINGTSGSRPVRFVDTQPTETRFVKPAEPEKRPRIGDLLSSDFFEAIGVSSTGDNISQERASFLVAQTRHFAALYEVGQIIQQHRDADEMLGQVMSLILQVTEAERGFVALLDERGRLIPRAYGDTSGEHRGRSIEMRLSETVARQVLDARCGVITADAAEDHRFAGARSVMLNDVHALLAVPILHGERVLGLIEIESSKSINAFDEGHLDLLVVVAATVGVALENLSNASERERTIVELEAAQKRLIATQQQLIRSEQMAVVGRMASGIAHEVKNHLSPLMLAEMLRRRYPDDEEIQQATELMLEAQRRIVSLVDDIKRFSRGIAPSYSIASGDLRDLVEGVIRFVGCDKAVKSTTLNFHGPDAPVVAEIDGDRIRQVLINLIRNAADAAPRVEGTIDVRLESDSTRARIIVADNGDGIPLDVQARIFEPFFTTKGEHGLGLGLDISRAIVRAHHGQLAFRSAPGYGTVFTIALPLRRPANADADDGGEAG